MDENDFGKPILAVDWGRKRLGLAISDPTGTIARPLEMIEHVSRRRDAERIIEIALERSVGLIIVGVTYNENSIPTHTGKSSIRLLEEIKSYGDIPVLAWDEEDSTRSAISTNVEMGSSRKKRKGHLDSKAAAIFLQNFLNSKFEK